MRKAKVYIDGANVFYAQQKLGWSIDWKKFQEFISKDRDVLEWRYYVAIKENDERMQSYLRYLGHIGFSLITKPLKKIETGEGSFIYKANFDVEITADMLLNYSDIEEFVLVSGDSDFRYLLECLKGQGKSTTVCASKKTLSWELKLSRSSLILLEKVKENIMRK